MARKGKVSRKTKKPASVLRLILMEKVNTKLILA